MGPGGFGLGPLRLRSGPPLGLRSGALGLWSWAPGTGIWGPPGKNQRAFISERLYISETVYQRDRDFMYRLYIRYTLNQRDRDFILDILYIRETLYQIYFISDGIYIRETETVYQRDFISDRVTFI